MQLWESKIAQHAWDCVQAVSQKGLMKEYLRLVRGAGAVLRSSGLAAACALWAGEDKAAQQLYNHVKQWLVDQAKIYGSQNGPLGLVVSILQGNVATYRRAMRDTYVLLGWLKLFAEAQSNQRTAAEDDEQGRPEAAG